MRFEVMDLDELAWMYPNHLYGKYGTYKAYSNTYTTIIGLDYEGKFMILDSVNNSHPYAKGGIEHWITDIKMKRDKRLKKWNDKKKQLERKISLWSNIK